MISCLCKDNNQQTLQGFKFLLLETPALVTCFPANHGNTAWRAGLTIIASKQDGQGEHVKVAHLLGKDLYNVLCKAVQSTLHKGIRYLTESALLGIPNNVGE